MKNFTQNKLVLVSLSLLFIGLSYRTKAQVTDFKMNNYKYRTNGMKAIGLNVGGNSSLNAGGSSSFSFGFSPGTAFTKQYSKANKQLDFWNWSNINLARPAGDNPFQWLVNSRVEWTQRNYKGNNFLEFGSNSEIGANKGQQANMGLSGENKNNETFYSVSLNPYAGVGQGRLEFVSNAQMALFILEDLKEAGKIKGTVSKELTYKFTDLITQLYNTRVFDFRKRRNYEVAKIDSFLRQNKIISSTDVNTYNIIADNWNYAIQPSALESTYFLSGTLQVPSWNTVSDRINQFGIFDQTRRYAGTRTSIIVDLPSTLTNGAAELEETGPGLIALDSITKSRLTTVTGVNVSAMWEKHTAKDLHHQEVIMIWASGGSTQNGVTTKYNINKADSTSKTKITGAGIGASYLYSIFPNSRTVISTNTRATINYSISKLNDLPATKNTAIMLSTFIKASYFINYKSRISGQGGIDITPKGYVGSKVNVHFTLNYVNYLF